VVTNRTLSVEGSATAGATISLTGAASVTAKPTYALQIALTPGKNELRLTATLGTQQKQLTRVVYFADPARLEPVKERFVAVQRELHELAGLKRELESTVAGLKARLAQAGDAQASTELETELTSIEEARRQLDTDVANALRELDDLLK
jgi:predicted  nucleic acid-binding Zn-ribbon protein